jgi:MazG family protein
LAALLGDAHPKWSALLLPPLAPLAALASPWAMPWISARLRAPDGCPWDREQTHLTLAKHLIEESWELHDAIEAQAANPNAETDAALAEELGDVLLQVILHTQLAAERGAFDLTDVQERLAQKIIRRHPHVFGEGSAETSREVQRTWEAVKAQERAARGGSATNASGDALGTSPATAPFRSALGGVSRGLPALSASRELQDRASAMGYDWPTLDGVREQFAEEIQELKEALEEAGNPDLITGTPASSAEALAAAQGELGDVIAVLVNLGRRSGIDAEAALRAANEKFRRRFGEVERQAAVRAIDLKSADFATLDTLWDEAKAAERAGELPPA